MQCLDRLRVPAWLRMTKHRGRAASMCAACLHAVGGNHEAANHLWELYYGGWAAPNIYFLGFAGAVKFGGLRIAGLSGIYKQQDYLRGHHERAPLDERTMRSMYHVRDFEVYRLMQVSQYIMRVMPCLMCARLHSLAPCACISPCAWPQKRRSDVCVHAMYICMRMQLIESMYYVWAC